MTATAIIKEVSAIKTDFLNGMFEIAEVIEMLQNFSKEVNRDFTDLYNAFYSSNPSLYIN